MLLTLHVVTALNTFRSHESTFSRLFDEPACNVLYLNSVETESLTGPEAVSKATKCTLALSPRPVATVVHFKVSSQGITLTDSKRRCVFNSLTLNSEWLFYYKVLFVVASDFCCVCIRLIENLPHCFGYFLCVHTGCFSGDTTQSTQSLSAAWTHKTRGGSLINVLDAAAAAAASSPQIPLVLAYI